MSQKKKPQPKKAEKVKNEKASGKKSTKIIIAAAVAIVVIAAVLVGIFVIKPAISDNDDTTSEVSFSDVEKNDNERFDYVNYKGTRMAKDLALVLEQAEKDGKAAAEKYGVAFEIGDREISKSEFAMNYQDQYRIKMYEVDYSIQLRGSNLTGYDPEVLPSEQKYPGEDYTWADKFVADAIDTMIDLYATFDKAIESGITLTEVEIDRLMTSYQRVEEYVINSDKNEDEYVASVYGEGATYAMFARREIIETYAVKYEEVKGQEYYDGCTEEELQTRFNQDPDLYAAIKARVYPIQAEYDAVELSEVNTEQEFLDFAKKNYPAENYNAEVITQAYYVTKESLSSTFDEKVGEWAFDDNRVPGEVGLVTGQLYEYLVYIESLPTYEYSHDVIIYNYTFEGDETAEEIEEIYYQVEEYYNQVKDKEITPEQFQGVFNGTSNGWYETAARASDFYYEVTNWILDDERKSGDTGMFADSSEGIYVIYYKNANPDDLDWEHYLRSTMSDEKYLADYEEFIKEYDVKENKSVIEKTIEAANVKIQGDIEEAKTEAS